MDKWQSKLCETTWQGNGELWLDPEGNSAEHYACEMRIVKGFIDYSWQRTGETKEGSFKFNKYGAIWSDSWHQEQPVQCLFETNSRVFFSVSYHYGDPSGPQWGWRSMLSQRPDDSLVLQMTNIAPWGEEGRAVRMVFKRI